MSELGMALAIWGAISAGAVFVGLAGERWRRRREDHALAVHVEQALTAGAAIGEPNEAAAK